MDDFNILEYIDEFNLEDRFADLCRTKEEVDAVVACLEIIDHGRNDYHYAVELQPKDPTGRQRTLDTLIDEATTQQEKDLILAEWSATYNWRSTVKDVKYDILDTCMKILDATDMKKTNKKKLLPRFTEYLISEETREIDQDERARMRILGNKIERWSKLL